MTLQPIAREPQFRPCSNCGNLIPVSSVACQYCGAVSAESAAAAHEAALARRFVQALFTRPAPFTMIVLGANLAMFLLEWLAGGMGPMSVDHAVLLGFGAKANPLIVSQHQYWRLITCVFLHIGFVHFLMNNYILWIIGREVEQIYGSARFVILYVATGAIASLSSFYFSPNAVSAGASGAIFGLFGVAGTFAFRHRREIPPALATDIRRKVLPMIGINLMFGFAARGVVDNSAHLGGLIAGVLLALVIPFMRPGETATQFVWRAIQVVCFVTVLASFVAMFASYDGPKPGIANLTASPNSRVPAYFDQMTSARMSLRDSINSVEKAVSGNRPGELDAALRDAEEGIVGAERAPVVGGQGENFRQRLLGLLREQKELVGRDREEGASYKAKAAGENSRIRDSFQQFQAEFDPWLAGFLKENGYEIKRRRTGE